VSVSAATTDDTRAVGRATDPDALTPKGRRRREQLLDAAAIVIAREGYAGATQRAIATEAGVPPASTHYFFASIEDLVQQATIRYLEGRLAFYEERIDVFAASDRSPEEGTALVAQLLTEVDVEQRVTQFEVYLNARRVPGLAPTVHHVIDELERLCARLLDVMGVPDPERWAAAFLAVGDGFALRAVAGAPVDVDALGRTFLAVVLAHRVVPGPS
jgi:DNA-binding transcriptional regulator YbjK